MAYGIETKKFQRLVGGISSTDTEKEECLNLIKNAILNNLKGSNPSEVDLVIFAKSYPESLELVKLYYDSLYTAKEANLTIFDGQTYINKSKRLKEYREALKKEMQKTLIIFAPELMNKEMIEIKKMFGFTMNEIASIFNYYKKIVHRESKIEDLDLLQEKYRIAKIIYDEIVINGLKKYEVCQKYKIGNQSLNTYLEALKEIDEKLYIEVAIKLNNNSSERFRSLSELILLIGTYYKDKIKVETSSGIIELPFTMLDYYSLTDYSPNAVIKFINETKNLNNSSNEELEKRAAAREMLLSQKNVGIFMSREKFLESGISAGKEGNIIKITSEICDKIFDLFESEGIPNSKFLLDTAFYRYVLGKPILPLKRENKIKVIEEGIEEIQCPSTKK